MESDKNIINSQLSHRLYYILRAACAMCFIGHGAFGIITKQVWCNYFGVFGIGEHLSYQLMPVVGTIDILLGMALIVYPIRAVAGWLVVWGLFTALLRPLSGEPFAEFIERAGNFGAPFALLLLSGGLPGRGLFGQLIPSRPLDSKTLGNITLSLRVFGFLLLLGHGCLNLIEKEGLLHQYQIIGFEHPGAVARVAGMVEIAGALAVLIRPAAGIIIVLVVWKMASELFYPHYGLFEWIERGGSYGVLLALWVSQRQKEGVGSWKKQHSFATPATA